MARILALMVRRGVLDLGDGDSSDAERGSGYFRGMDGGSTSRS
jgi:hypothetical protein